MKTQLTIASSVDLLWDGAAVLDGHRYEPGTPEAEALWACAHPLKPPMVKPKPVPPRTIMHIDRKTRTVTFS